jgi:Ca2+/Na+ antiporter
MTALLVSVIIWGIVAFMATDEYCRVNEARTLRFLVGTGIVLMLVGVWSFEVTDFDRVSFSDWLMVGFFPIFLVYLRLKTQLTKSQAQHQGRVTPPSELDLDVISERSLVRNFQRVRVIMWVWAVVALLVHLWSRSGLSI